MKVSIRETKQIEAKFVRVVLPVGYEEEDIPNDFPLRLVDTWTARIEIDSGRIIGWPEGRAERLYMKVCDEGCYYVMDEKGVILKSIEEDYVPHGLIPGQYGDYVDFEIDANGIITNWPKKPSLKDFRAKDSDED